MNQPNPIEDPSLLKAAEVVVRMHLDDAVVHPCDEYDDQVRAAQCLPEVQDLFQAVQRCHLQQEQLSATMTLPAGAMLTMTAEEMAVAIEKAFRPRAYERVGCAGGYLHAIDDIVKALRAGGFSAVAPTAGPDA